MKYTLNVRQGDKLDFTARYTTDGSPVDLTGYTSEMVITWPSWRYDNAAPIDADEILLTMDALDSTGVIGAHLTDTQTPLIPVSVPQRPGPPVSWQLRIIGGGQNETLCSGPVRVEPDFFALVT